MLFQVGLLFRLFNQGATGGLTLADAIVGDDVLKNIWTTAFGSLVIIYLLFIMEQEHERPGIKCLFFKSSSLKIQQEHD